MNVAVTGASGHLGRQVADLLIDRLDPARLVLLSRTTDTLTAHAEQGAAVRRADFDEPSALVEALAGVDRLLLISTFDIGRRVGQHRAAIDAAKEAGVRHVIYTSMPDPRETNPAVVAADHRATEEALRESGLAWTFLRNNIYAEYQVPVAARALADGRIVTSAGDGRTAYVSRADCAAAAAAVLTQDGHEGRAYDITGPQALGAEHLAALAADLGAASVDVLHIDDEAAVAGMVASGLPEQVARVYVSFDAAAREGYLATVSTAVQDLTGRAPSPLRDVLATASPELVAAAAS